MNNRLIGVIVGSCFFASTPSLADWVLDDSDFPPADPAKEALGKLLMFDKILSGNQNISCASCHHPLAGLGDGLALPVGEGGEGLGINRNTGTDGDGVHERVPRNAPHVYNLGATEITVMFHDGRVAVAPDQPGGFLSPAGAQLPDGLDNALAAQAMFPVTSGAEMAGQPGENPIADAAAANNLAGAGGVWDQIAGRLRSNPEYVDLFKAAYADIDSAADITYVHAANAIAAFEGSAWRCSDAPFDRWFRNLTTGGDPYAAASPDAVAGGMLFYGKAGCSTCHDGPLQTDQQFYAIGVPQIGPGKGDGADGHDDFGRERVTGDPADRFKFRTPSLRQVAQTGPWGHDGAFDTLEGMVRHHLDAVASLNAYDTSQAVLPSRPDLDAIDFIAYDDTVRRQAVAGAVEIEPLALSEQEISQLMDFLHALTDPGCIDLRHTSPSRVPSGLPMYD